MSQETPKAPSALPEKKSEQEQAITPKQLAADRKLLDAVKKKYAPEVSSTPKKAGFVANLFPNNRQPRIPFGPSDSKFYAKFLKVAYDYIGVSEVAGTGDNPWFIRNRENVKFTFEDLLVRLPLIIQDKQENIDAQYAVQQNTERKTLEQRDKELTLGLEQALKEPESLAEMQSVLREYQKRGITHITEYNNVGKKEVYRTLTVADNLQEQPYSNPNKLSYKGQEPQPALGLLTLSRLPEFADIRKKAKAFADQIDLSRRERQVSAIAKQNGKPRSASFGAKADRTPQDPTDTPQKQASERKVTVERANPQELQQFLGYLESIETPPTDENAFNTFKSELINNSKRAGLNVGVYTAIRDNQKTYTYAILQGAGSPIKRPWEEFSSSLKAEIAEKIAQAQPLAAPTPSDVVSAPAPETTPILPEVSPVTPAPEISHAPEKDDVLAFLKTVRSKVDASGEFINDTDRADFLSYFKGKQPRLDYQPDNKITQYTYSVDGTNYNNYTLQEVLAIMERQNASGDDAVDFDVSELPHSGGVSELQVENPDAVNMPSFPYQKSRSWVPAAPTLSSNDSGRQTPGAGTSMQSPQDQQPVESGKNVVRFGSVFQPEDFLPHEEDGGTGETVVEGEFSRVADELVGESKNVPAYPYPSAPKWTPPMLVRDKTFNSSQSLRSEDSQERRSMEVEDSPEVKKLVAFKTYLTTLEDTVLQHGGFSAREDRINFIKKCAEYGYPIRFNDKEKKYEISGESDFFDLRACAAFLMTDTERRVLLLRLDAQTSRPSLEQPTAQVSTQETLAEGEVIVASSENVNSSEDTTLSPGEREKVESLVEALRSARTLEDLYDAFEDSELVSFPAGDPQSQQMHFVKDELDFLADILHYLDEEENDANTYKNGGEQFSTPGDIDFLEPWITKITGEISGLNLQQKVRELVHRRITEIDVIPTTVPEAPKGFAEKKVESDVTAEDKFQKVFSITEASLEGIDGYTDLTPAQKLLVFENVKAYADQGKGPMYRGFYQGFLGVQLDNVPKAGTKGIEAYRSVITALVQDIKEKGVKVYRDPETNELLTPLVYVDLQGKRENRKDILDASMQVENAARALARTPETWRYAGGRAPENESKIMSFLKKKLSPERRNREEYQARERALEEAKSSLVSALYEAGAPQSEITKTLLDIDRRVAQTQMFLANPDLEEKAQNIPPSVLQKIGTFAKDPANYLYLGLGAGTRLFASAMVGIATAPILAGTLGGIRGWNKKDAEQRERDRMARLGAQDSSGAISLNIASATKTKEPGKMYKNELQIGAVDKLERVIEEVHGKVRIVSLTNGMSSVDDVVRLFERLKSRVEYTEDKIRLGRMSFGTTPAERATQMARAYKTLAEAKVLIEVNRGFLMRQETAFDRFEAKDKVKDTKRNDARNQEKRVTAGWGVLKGASLSLAGIFAGGALEDAKVLDKAKDAFGKAVDLAKESGAYQAVFGQEPEIRVQGQSDTGVVQDTETVLPTLTEPGEAQGPDAKALTPAPVIDLSNVTLEPPAPAVPAPEAPSNPELHTVQNGDTVWKIMSGLDALDNADLSAQAKNTAIANVLKGFDSSELIDLGITSGDANKIYPGDRIDVVALNKLLEAEVGGADTEDASATSDTGTNTGSVAQSQEVVLTGQPELATTERVVLTPEASQSVQAMQTYVEREIFDRDWETVKNLDRDAFFNFNFDNYSNEKQEDVSRLFTLMDMALQTPSRVLFKDGETMETYLKRVFEAVEDNKDWLDKNYNPPKELEPQYIANHSLNESGAALKESIERVV